MWPVQYEVCTARYNYTRVGTYVGTVHNLVYCTDPVVAKINKMYWFYLLCIPLPGGARVLSSEEGRVISIIGRSENLPSTAS